MKYKISVVVPSYNRAHCLPRSLDSVIRQTLHPLEIIVIDDGSEDETRHLVSRNYPSVIYRYQDNTGVSGARNTGVRLSRGNWIAFLDSDDEWLPEKLARQVKAITENPEFQLCHTNEIWIRHGTRVNPMNKHEKCGGQIFEKCLPACAISPSSVILSKALFDEVGGFDETLPACEDYDLWLKICSCHPVLYLEDLLLKKYGGHQDQLSRKYWGMDRFRVQALENILASGNLGETQSKAVREMLLGKCQILASGALKRGKTDRAKIYQDKIEFYQGVI